MNEISEQLKKARIDKGLSLTKVSEDTKIRLHILEDIENGRLDTLPEIYMKSFIKELSKYYKINIDTNINANLIPAEPISNTEISNDESGFKIIPVSKKNIAKKEVIETPAKDIEPKKVENLSKPKKVITYDDENIETIKDVKDFKKSVNPEVAVYAEQFKKRQKIQKVSRININNLIFFASIALIVIVGTAIAYFLLNKEEIPQTNVTPNHTKDDTVKVVAQNDNLLSYFQKNDSLLLRGVASDTAWIRLVIDDKRYVEDVLRTGDTKDWYAAEKFGVDVGNVGAITFYRNNELLPLFGRKGSVAKNIKITKDNVISINNYSKRDSTKAKKKKEEVAPPVIIESNINENNNILKKRSE